MKVRAPSKDGRYFDVQKLVHGLSLNTICEEARCPNISECWGRGTATFQILGDTCTRACRYCYVHSGKPEAPPDPLEPLRVAQAAAQMELKHVVVTSVDRDDVPDRGAGHYAATIRALKAKLPDGVRRGADARLPRRRGGGAARPCSPPGPRSSTTTSRRCAACTGRCAARRRATTRRSGCSQRAKELADYPVLTKSGIIVGLGETNDEVVETLRDLRAHGVDVVTIGQYLQPSPKHAHDRPLGAPRRVPLAPRAGRGARLRLRLRRPARALELPRRRAAARGRDRPRRRRVLASMPCRSRSACRATTPRADGDRTRRVGQPRPDDAGHDAPCRRPARA